MTRLTFIKNERGDVLSTKQFLARDKLINGYILISDLFIYFIIDLGSGKALEYGIVDSESNAKKMVKDKFKELGIIFYDEIRKKLEDENE